MENISKLIAPEDQSALLEVIGLIQQLLNANSTGVPENQEGTAEIAMAQNAEPAMPAMKENGMEDQDIADEEVQMAANKSSDGPTASEDAEARTEAGTNLTEDNISSLGKALMAVLGKSQKTQQVQKSEGTQIATVLAEMQKAHKAEISELKKSFNAVLEAVGVADALESVTANDPVQTVTKSMAGQNQRPVTNPDQGVLMDELVSRLSKAIGKEVHNPESFQERVEKERKDLANSMAGMFINRGEYAHLRKGQE
jgi:hypothetical protein